MTIHGNHNSQSQISIYLGSHVGKTGQMIQGTVKLTFSDKDKEDAVDLHRIQLELHGRERVSHQGVTQEETFLKYPQVVHEFGAPFVYSGVYSYDFEVSLPVCLPGSLHVAQPDASAEIVYTLSAAAINSRSVVKWKCAKDLTIQAEEKNIASIQGHRVVMMPHGFPIYTNLVFLRGQIHFGWQCESDVWTTGDCVSVSIVGQNQSDVDIKDFVVRLTESVVLMHPSFHNVKIQRILAISQVNTQDIPAWKAMSKTAGVPTTVSFRVPKSILCESRSGSLFYVQHRIEVIAESAVDRTTNPRLSCPVSLLKRAESTGTFDR